MKGFGEGSSDGAGCDQDELVKTDRGLSAPCTETGERQHLELNEDHNFFDVQGRFHKRTVKLGGGERREKGPAQEINASFLYVLNSSERGKGRCGPVTVKLKEAIWKKEKSGRGGSLLRNGFGRFRRQSHDRSKTRE